MIRIQHTNQGRESVSRHLGHTVVPRECPSIAAVLTLLIFSQVSCSFLTKQLEMVGKAGKYVTFLTHNYSL